MELPHSHTYKSMASGATITKGKYLEDYIHIPYKPDLLIPCVPAAGTSVVNEHGSLALVWRSGTPDGVDPDNVRSSREAPNSSHTLGSVTGATG